MTVRAESPAHDRIGERLAPSLRLCLCGAPDHRARDRCVGAIS